MYPLSNIQLADPPQIGSPFT